MKSYAEKNFSKDYLEKVDIQNVGVYYDVPIENIAENKLGEFDIDEEQTSILLDHHSIYNSDEYVIDTSDISYEYTDEYEIDDFISGLMNYKAYDHYLVVLFGAKWNGASGYKIFNSYKECFCRDYDVSMYYKGSSSKGKVLSLKEYHHDCPMGHTSVIVGLTENEYQKLLYKDIDDIIQFGEKCADKCI